MKPGYQTSEFWISLASQALGLLVLLHVITPEAQGTLATPIANAVTAAFTIFASAQVVKHYIASRTAIKQSTDR
jgi:hypothetical protein